MTEQEREEKFRDWCAMWVDREDRGITELFTQEAEYIESWGPAYCGAAEIAHWFREWNTRGRVAEWTVGEFFHKGDQSVARWRFRCEMADGTVQRFEGMSLLRWTPEGKIAFLQEFGCNLERYDPYAAGPEPVFREEKALWF